MPCQGCGHDNPDDARFCSGCGAPQQRSCSACGRANDADASFCNGCGRPVGAAAEAPPPAEPRDYTPRHLAERILRSRTALEGERKQVTIFFADVKGSTELAGALDPEAWHQVLDGFFRILSEGIHRFEGTVNQYTGDGIMALFGAPLAHEDHAQRACFAARWLREPLRDYADRIRREQGQSFSVRIGIHSGEVVVGKIGDDLRMDYTAQGLSATLAQRMEQLAEPGTAYLTDETARLAEGYFEFADLGEFNVKGLPDPVRVHRLEDVGAVRTRLALSRARGFSSFVGREPELEMLEAALSRSVQGEGQVASIVGEAGVGKSRLCLEFVERCRARGIPVLEAHCPSHGRAVPLLPVLQMTRGFFGIDEADDAASARQKIAGSLVLLDDALREDIPLACDFLGVPDPDRPLPPMDAEVRRRRVQDFVRRLIEARSVESPAILLFDDLHWIDSESEAFVAQLISIVGHTRTFVLGNQRPEYDPPWKVRPDYQQIALSPLGRAEALVLAGELLGEDPSVRELSERLVERAGGNPFFTEELVRMLADSGGLDGEPGAYRAARTIDTLELPPTVQAILAARIDRLGEDEKRLLRAAAVAGREVSEPILRAVTDLDGEDLDAALAQLDEAGLLLQQSLYPVAEYAFRHPLTHEVAYGSQLAARRAETHALVARAFEDLHAESLDEHASLIAHHWDLADAAEPAIHWHRRAALAQGSRNVSTSLLHWKRVRERLGEIEPSEETVAARVEACTQILYGTILSGGDDSADSDWELAYEEGIALAEQLGDEAIRASLLSGVAGLRGFRGEHRAQVELLEEALELAQRRGDFAMEAALLQRVGWAWMLAGDNNRTIEWSRRGIEFCERDLPRSGAVTGFGTYAFLLGQLGGALVEAGQLEEASPVLDRAEAVSLFTDDVFSLGTARSTRLEVAWLRGDREELVAIRDRLVAEQDEGPSGLSAGMMLSGLAWALAELGDWAGASKATEEAGADTARIVSLHLGFQLLAVRAHAELGERDRACTLLDEIRGAYERIPALKNDSPMALLRWSEAHRILYGASAREEIEDACERIIEAARERGWGAYEPFALVERAELAGLLGDGAARRRDLDEAAALFRKLGAPLRADAAERS
ncbi:MAG: AAA family ATPase [Deltaproteobacteria bacterium]|nr:AAA family ATPase [Deltaproteobacteria bacterium]